MASTSEAVQLAELGAQKKFGTILADPPWSYKDLGHSRRIDRQYPVLSIAELCALPVADLAAKDSVLFLWTPAPLLFEAEPVMRAWGFTNKSNIVWDKTIFGMGYYARIRHEHLLIGTRGKPGISAVHDIPSVIAIRRTRHSVKPVEFYNIIERMYPRFENSRIELFARRRWPGWQAWGNDHDPRLSEAVRSSYPEA